MKKDGNVVAIFDKDETYDEEDNIDIQVNKNTIIRFFPSKIKSIEDVKHHFPTFKQGKVTPESNL